MSDVMDSYDRFTKPPELVVPNPERFGRTARLLMDQSRAFFGSAYRSVNYRGYFSVFRKALNTVELTREEHQVYDKWQARELESAVRLGQDSRELLPDELVLLASQNDPAAYIIGKLETIRADSFPNIEHDVLVRASVYGAYTLFVAGVNIDRVFE